jgi:hypothetical protein
MSERKFGAGLCHTPTDSFDGKNAPYQSVNMRRSSLQLWMEGTSLNSPGPSCRKVIFTTDSFRQFGYCVSMAHDPIHKNV